MRTTIPASTVAAPGRSLRRGGAVMAMLLLVLALLAPSAVAAEGTPPDHAAEPAHENTADDDTADDAEAGEDADGQDGSEETSTDESEGQAADDADGPDENAADNAQTGEPNENANAQAQDSVDETDEGDEDPTEPDTRPAGDDQRSDRADEALENAPGQNGDDEGTGDEGTDDDDTNAAGGEGNRGHIQLSSDGETFPPDNEPHLPCEFFVMFYDMREGTEQATVEFFAQPPSGGPGELLLTDTVDLNGLADEGVTFNGSEQYDLEPYVDGLTYHDQQGYHIRLTVTTTPEDVSADEKHHVFWIDCAPEEEPAPADVLVDKVVTGDDSAPDADTTFTIEVTCDGVTETVTITDGDDPWSWNDDGTADDLTENATCTVTETDAQGADTITVTFNGTTVDQGDSLALDPGDNTIVVTNDYEAAAGVDVDDEGEESPGVGVLPDEVERPAPTTPGAPFVPDAAPAADQVEEQPAVAVQDTAAERLPRTGVSSTALLLLALALLGGGATALRRTSPAVGR